MSSLSLSESYDCILLNHEGHELKNIKLKNIHPDDSIQSLKIKLIREFSNHEIVPVSYEEIYLFSETPEHSFLPLGKKFTQKYETSFYANPYLVQLDDSGNLFSGNPKNPLLTLENMLILNHESFQPKIYICFAKDVLEFSSKKQLDSYVFLKLYFPLLILHHNIESIDDLNLQHQSLLQSTEEKIKNEYILKSEKNVNLFYDVYFGRKTELNYLKNGITSFMITLLPVQELSLPLEILFKNIHSTQTIPFIKFNPGFKRENMYRLYSENLSKYGEKVPYLEKNVVLRLAKQMGRKKTLSFFLEGKTISYEGIYDLELYLELNTQGQIHIQGNAKKPMNIESLDEQISNKTNFLIEHLNSILLKSGHSLASFTSLLDSSRVKIVSLTNHWSMKIKHEIPLKKMAKCLHPIFEFYSQEKNVNALENGLDARFKRVENYQSMQTEDIFINEIYSKNEDLNFLLESFLESFPERSEQYAKEKIVTFFNDLSEHKIKKSPGFYVHMDIQSFNDSVFTFQCNITDHIDYLKVLNIYVDSLLRITQEPSTTSVVREVIQSLCLKPAKTTLQEKHDEKESEKINEVMSGVQSVDYIPIQPIQYTGSVDFFSTLEPSVLKESFGEDDDQDEEDEKLQKIQEDEEIADFEIEFENDEEEQEGGGEDDLLLDGGMLDSLPTHEQYAGFGYSFVGGGEEEKDTDHDETKDSQENLEQYKKQLHGMNLYEGNDNIFLKRLKDRDPMLFLNEDVTTSKGKFNAYAKKCQANAGRQPVILTQEEKDEIDKKHPGSYKNALEYGSNKNKKHWFICPRYWCLLTNSSITEEEFKKGVCGNVIKNDKVTEGHYVIENKNEKLHMVNGKYVEANPGFLKSGLHPNDLCLPCCFKKTWDSSQLKQRRQECLESDEAEETTATNSLHADDKRARNPGQASGYIVGYDKYPVEKGRWGFLPMSAQYLLQMDQSKMLDNSGKLKKNVTTFLRAGMEESATKSFVACIADVYSSMKGMVPTLSVENMCKVIVDAIDLDVFVKLHNGSLPVAFKPDKYNMDKINYDQYRTFEFVKKLSFEEAIAEDFLADTIAAYENFQEFIMHRESNLNHEYLWDVVCMPNPKLFPNGLNLAILYIPENDVTENIEVLCPSASYSNQLYDDNKQTLLLILRENIFEPVYLYETYPHHKDPKIVRAFKPTYGPASLQFVLQTITNTSRNYCSPLPSMPKIYKFKRNHPAPEIMTQLNKHSQVVAQVLNYQGKVIGIMTPDVYVPTLPSSMLSQDIPVMYMDDIELWKSYVKTRDALLELHQKSKGAILCKPTHKVVEENTIVGILTETNQFLMVHPPCENIEMDDLIEVNETNYLLADKDFASNQRDTTREIASKRIKFETHFYKIFRSTMRLVLHQAENQSNKKLLQSILSNEKKSSQKKFKQIHKWLIKILKKYVDFQIYDDSVWMAFEDITTCGPHETDDGNQNYCFVQGNSRKLVLPKFNLLSQKDNEYVYYTRLTDEILRNKRIQTYLLDETIFDIGISNQYNVNETEMIVLQSLMTAEYFSQIGPPVLKTRGKIPYEMAMPYQTAPYVNNISLDEQINMYNKGDTEIIENTFEVECTKEYGEMVGNQLNVWKKIFPPRTKELFLHNTPKCTFLPIIFIYKEVYGKTITVDELKTKLLLYYKSLYPYNMAIMKMWRLQGKREWSDKIKNGELMLDDVVMNDPFYLCNIDYWILCRELKLPVILFTSMNKIKHLMDSVSWVCLYRNKESGSYWFIRAPTEPDALVNNILGYSMLTKPYHLLEIPKFNAWFEKSDRENNASFMGLLEFLEKHVQK